MKGYIISVVVSLIVGGFATSFAEYKLDYNLIDLIVDKIKSAYGTAKKDVNAVRTDIKNKI